MQSQTQAKRCKIEPVVELVSRHKMRKANLINACRAPTTWKWVGWAQASMAGRLACTCHSLRPPPNRRNVRKASMERFDSRGFAYPLLTADAAQAWSSVSGGSNLDFGRDNRIAELGSALGTTPQKGGGLLSASPGCSEQMYI